MSALATSAPTAPRYSVRMAQPRELRWLEETAAWRLTSSAIGMAAVDSAGRVRAVVAYDEFTPNSCHVHQASESPIAWRRLLPAAFIFPFEHLRLGVGFATVPASNTLALRQTRAFGFREVYRMKDGWCPGDDLVLHEIRREDAVAKGWLPALPGKAG